MNIYYIFSIIMFCFFFFLQIIGSVQPVGDILRTADGAIMQYNFQIFRLFSTLFKQKVKLAFVNSSTVCAK